MFNRLTWRFTPVTKLVLGEAELRPHDKPMKMLYCICRWKSHSVMKLAKSRLNAHEAESRVRSFFETNPDGVIAVYLFGSFARGSERPESDVDIAVLYADPPAKTFDELPLALEERLESRLGRQVEVVVLNHASADLIHHVLKDGRLLIDLAPSSRIQFEVRARNEYFDLQPILHRYRRTKR